MKFDRMILRPVIFFYNTRKDSASCDIILAINNISTDFLSVNYGRSYLVAGDDTLRLKGTHHGSPIPIVPTSDITIGPGVDSSFGLAFKGKISQFRQEVRLVLHQSNTDTIITYQRKR